MANPWFRMYAEFANDAKVQMLSESMQRRYIMLMCLRCSNSLVTLQDEEVAFQLRISNDELAETKSLFISKGFIDLSWNLLNWEKRQFASDTSKARVAKHRSLLKEKQNPASNTDVTLQKQKSNALDTDTDTDKKNTPLPPNGGDVLFAKFWSAYPRKVGKDVARKAFAKRKPSIELVDLMVQAVNRQKMTPQWAKDGGQFIPHPSTWINEGRWMDGEQPSQSDSTWFREAGFDFDWVANNAGCYPSNFKKFANGKRLESA